VKIQHLVVGALASVFFTDAALAACKFKEDTNDYFSGVPTLRTPWTRINTGDCTGDCNARGSLSIVSEAGKQRLEFDAWFSYSSVFLPTQDHLDNAFIVPVGATLVISLADGSKVELPISDPVVGETSITYPYENNNDNYTVHASARMRFDLDSAELSALAAQKSTVVRLVKDGTALVMHIQKKKQTVMDAAQCLSAEVTQ
jgi:hypothetical protein